MLELLVCEGQKIQAEEMWTNGSSGERTTKRKSRHNGIKIASQKRGDCEQFRRTMRFWRGVQIVDKS